MKSRTRHLITPTPQLVNNLSSKIPIAILWCDAMTCLIPELYCGRHEFQCCCDDAGFWLSQLCTSQLCNYGTLIYRELQYWESECAGKPKTQGSHIVHARNKYGNMVKVQDAGNKKARERLCWRAISKNAQHLSPRKNKGLAISGMHFMFKKSAIRLPISSFLGKS